MGGLVQGKADVPQWSTQQSDILLKAHTSLNEGVNIRSPNLLRHIKHCSIAFADDTDGQESSETNTHETVSTIVARLQRSAQTWSNLVQICGGQIALHKCFWQLIAWQDQDGILSMMKSTDEILTMTDGAGTSSTIEYLPPDMPNVGLGYIYNRNFIVHLMGPKGRLTKIALSGSTGWSRILTSPV